MPVVNLTEYRRALDALWAVVHRLEDRLAAAEARAAAVEARVAAIEQKG